MPQISADKVIGKTLITKKRVNVYHNCKDKTPMYSIVANRSAGVVTSYVQKACGGELWWVFGKFDKNDPYDRQKNRYMIKHEKGAFQITDAIRTEIQKEKAEQENVIKEQKGAIQFYIDKYLPWVGGFILLAIVLKNKIK